MRSIKILALSLALVVYACACKQSSSSGSSAPKQSKAQPKIASLVLPEQNQKLALGEEISVELSWPDTAVLDSVEVFLKGESLGAYEAGEEIAIGTAGGSVGKAGLRVKLHFSGGYTETHSRNVEVLSDLLPKNYGYQIVKEYPHDPAAYTQGLLFYKGELYEGTGNWNQSTLRKVKLEDGSVLQVRNNPSDIFGEGITIFKDKIYQLTYKARVCFVYDLHTFDEVQKFGYQNAEGWGLTNNDTELIMSDGTHIIYYVDPDMFTIKGQVEVYDNKGPVSDLNELELINGKLYANRYYTDEIVIIDLETGRVEGRINLQGILPVSERKPSTNVLNGIAWDGKSNHLFVTGKYWPKMYEISVK
jgi:glutamine cyclotransferase